MKLLGRNTVLAVLGAAVIGLGTVVAVDHLSSSASKPLTATVAAATSKHPGHPWGPEAGLASPLRILGLLSREIGVPPLQIAAEIRAGETLDQIAGAKASKLETDALALVRTELDKAVAKGAISAGDESRLISDARDAISVLMGAHLGNLFPAGASR